jgi:serine/threonine protein kinase
MDRPSDLRKQGAAAGEEPEDPVRRFKRAWQEAGSEAAVDLSDYLPASQTPLRLVVLLELIKADLEIRWQRGKGVVLEQYLNDFPELGPASGLPTGLIRAEFQARQLHGDKPPLAAYRERFPQQFPELQRLVGDTRVGDNTVTSRGSPPAPANEPKPANYDPFPGDTGYKRIKRLGSGGFGEVWRAEAPGGVEVAVKIIFRPLSHAEAQRELQALELIKRLRHPFLLQTHAYWSMEDRLLIAMELADGSLRDRLKECQRAGERAIPVRELAIYFRESAEALDYLHGQNVLHRDIKPDNILLLKRHAKLADFGLARLLQNQRSIQASSVGTPAYMAPEVWRGRVGERSDQYSLAVTYAELRLGEPLFDTRDMFELMMNHLKQTPALDTLPRTERDVLLRALAKEPAQRYESCLTFVDALAQTLSEGSAGTIPDVPAPPDRRTIPRGQANKGSATVAPGQPPVVGDPYDSITDRVVDEGVSESKHAWADEGAATKAKDVSARPVPGQTPAWRPPQRRRWNRTALFLAPVLVALGFIGFGIWKNRQGSSAPNQENSLPDGCVAAEGAKLERIDDRAFYDKIDKALDDGTRVRFVLIPRGKDNPETFYIMQTKIPVSLFRKFAGAYASRLRDTQWEKLSSNKTEDNPVMGVVWDDARLCAAWLGGALPTEEQWKYAAGYYNVSRGEGPFLQPYNPEEPKTWVAVKRRDKGPAPGGSFANDTSPLGVNDMSGNGKEWTNDFLTLSDTSKREAGPGAAVVVCGHSYTDSRPLLYTDLQFPDSLPRNQADPETGFRVVIKP